MDSKKVMNLFMEPRSVAIIGLTRKTGPGSYNVLENMRRFGFPGKVFPVNPFAKKILGLKAYRHVGEIGEPVDLAVISTPREQVPAVLEDCANVGIRAAIVVPQGFADADDRGKAFQEEMRRIAQDCGIRVLGPNTLGVVNGFSGFTSSFVSLKRERSPVGVICQSGIFFFGSSQFSWKMGKGIDIGNGCDIDFADALAYMGDDDDIEVIFLHVEGTTKGRALFETVRRVARKKPIIALKSAKSTRGASKAATHTGAMIGDHAVFSAAFRQAGAIMVEDGEEAFDLVKSLLNLPPLEGKHLAVVTFTGAGGIMFVDALESHGLELARLSPATIQRAQESFPDWMHIGNPLDIWPAVMKHGLKPVYGAVLEAVLHDKSVDAVLSIAVAPPMPQMAYLDATSVIRATAEQFPSKPVVTWLYGPNQHAMYRDLEASGKVVAFPTVERAARALGALHQHSLFRRRKEGPVRTYRVKTRKVKEIVRSAIRSSGSGLGHESFAVLEAYGFPVAPTMVAYSLKQVRSAGLSLGFPVALKVSSSRISHKSDVGGVRLHIRNQAELRSAYRELMQGVKQRAPQQTVKAVLVQKMSDRGLEVILGAKRDPQFGPVVMFGLGGIHTEVLKDNACSLAPLSRGDALRMLGGIRAAPILEGVRGQEGFDTDFLAQCLMRLSQLITDIPEINEIDINPLMVFQQGGTAVDARIILCRTEENDS